MTIWNIKLPTLNHSNVQVEDINKPVEIPNEFDKIESNIV